MSAQICFFPGVTDENGQFLTSFSWLKTDYPESHWVVIDPVADENPKDLKLNYDGVLSHGLNFQDVPEIVEDLKRGLCFSVEINRHQPSLGTEVSSLSRIKYHHDSMKRIYRELYDMSLIGLDGLTEETLKELIERLQYREVVSQDYPGKISRYFAETPIDKLPVKIVKSRRVPSSLDKDQLCQILGLNEYALRYCMLSKSLIAEKNLEFAKLYPQYNFKTNDILSQSQKNEIAADENAKYAHYKSFSEAIEALDRVYRQSQLDGLFAHPLYLDPVNEDSLSIREKLETSSESRGRTRNIPANQFLMLLDRAARWVVDYADPLFELEAETIRYIEDNASDSDVDKKTASWLRELTQNNPYVGQKGSPFPLGGLKIGSKVSTKIQHSEELAEEIRAIFDSGESDAKIAKELNFTKSQVQQIRNRATTQNRHLPSTGVSLSQALYNYLPLSCALIILSFTAGRESGVYTLKPGCVTTKLGRRYINMFVPKTLRKHDDFPTVALVEKAVKVLERLSQRARNRTGDDNLFQFESPLAIDGSSVFNFDNYINNFVDFIDMEKDEDGNYFKFSEHQFRRFFAIMYFYRYDNGDFEALAYHLRHVDWSMTSVYLTEKEAGQILSEIEKERIKLAAIMSVDTTNDEYSGPMADEFMQAFDESLNMEHASEFEWADEIVEERDLVFDFIPPGLCFGNTPGYDKRALCAVEDENGEIFIRTHRASTELCFPCPNLLSCKSVKANHLAPRAADNIFSCDSPILKAAMANGVKK